MDIKTLLNPAPNQRPQWITDALLERGHKARKRRRNAVPTHRLSPVAEHARLPRSNKDVLERVMGPAMTAPKHGGHHGL